MEDTADAAWGLYLSLRDGLAWCVYVAERDQKGGKVAPRTREEVNGLARFDAEYQRSKTAFLNRVRVELGLPELAPSAPIFPDGGKIKPPFEGSATIDTNSYTSRTG